MKGRIKRDGEIKRLPFGRLGKVKIGMKNAKGYPQSVDYFIPTGKYASMFTSKLGDKPNIIQIVFPSDDASLVCNEHYEYRDNRGDLLAKGDGEEFQVWDGQRYQTFSINDYPQLMDGVARKHPSKSGWVITLEMNFIVPAISGVVGVWNFQTKGSESTIPQIREAFDNMKELNGTAAGVIFDLSVSFAKSQKPGVSSRYPVVTMVANESDENKKKFADVNYVTKCLE